MPFLSKDNQLIDVTMGRFLVLLKNLYILSLSTHGRFLQAKGQGYRQGLHAGFTGVGRCLQRCKNA